MRSGTWYFSLVVVEVSRLEDLGVRSPRTPGHISPSARRRSVLRRTLRSCWRRPVRSISECTAPPPVNDDQGRRALINPSINHQSINQSIDQSIDWSINRSIGQSIDRSIKMSNCTAIITLGAGHVMQRSGVRPSSVRPSVCLSAPSCYIVNKSSFSNLNRACGAYSTWLARGQHVTRSAYIVEHTCSESFNKSSDACLAPYAKTTS